jgi:hypothetical protein
MGMGMDQSFGGARVKLPNQWERATSYVHCIASAQCTPLVADRQSRLSPTGYCKDLCRQIYLRDQPFRLLWRLMMSTQTIELNLSWEAK